MREERITIQGIATRYLFSSGEKDAIVILHGWPSHADSWNVVGEMLAQQGLTVVIPDLPGFGGTGEPPSPWGVREYALWVKEFCATVLANKEFVLIGHSFGGRLGILGCTERILFPSRLILVDAAGIRHERRVGGMGVAKAVLALPLVRLFAPFLKKVAYKLLWGTGEYLQVSGVMKETFRMVVEQDLRENLSQIALPTLILWGEKDEKTPLLDGELIHEKVAGSRLVVFPGVRHSPHREDPQRFVEQIAFFLS